MQIDVYDFDGTLFRGDSTVAFWRYCLFSHPSLARFLPKQLGALVMMGLKKWQVTRGKSVFLCFLQGIDPQAEARRFWQDPKIRKRLFPYFEPGTGDLPVVIASASPAFLLEPIAQEYQALHLVGTRVDLATGEIQGNNCRHREKIARIQALIPGAVIHSMYTDSLRADGPLVDMAQQGFLIDRRGIVHKIQKRDGRH